MPERHSYQPTTKATALGHGRGRQRSLKHGRFRKRRFIAAMLLGAGIAYFQFRPKPLAPEAVLVLGGEPKREQFAAEFAKQHPGLPVWVSGGSNPEYADWIFQQAGVPIQLVHLDYDAVDTVTNFTTLADKLKLQDIRSIYLITSDYHMRRAQWIGHIVLGSRGIQFQSVSIPSHNPPESIEKAAFDSLRAILWVVTGDPGLSLKQEFK